MGMSGTFKDDETEQFFQLIHMFQRSSLLHMGMIPDNEGKFIFNLGEAKAGIDMLRVLQNKSKGNITHTGTLFFPFAFFDDHDDDDVLLVLVLVLSSAGDPPPLPSSLFTPCRPSSNISSSLSTTISSFFYNQHTIQKMRTCKGGGEKFVIVACRGGRNLLSRNQQARGSVRHL